MARTPSSEKTIEQQLSEIDIGVLAKGQYLYLYARPTTRATYWHLVLRNVYLPPTLDAELERKPNRQAAELALQHAALVFDCQYHLIDAYSLDYHTQPKYRRFPHRDDLHHPIELAVVPAPDDQFKAVVRNTRLNLVYDIGIPRPTVAEADADARRAMSFYQKPQEPPPVARKRPIPAEATVGGC